MTQKWNTEWPQSQEDHTQYSVTLLTFNSIPAVEYTLLKKTLQSYFWCAVTQNLIKKCSNIYIYFPIQLGPLFVCVISKYDVCFKRGWKANSLYSEISFPVLCVLNWSMVLHCGPSVFSSLIYYVCVCMCECIHAYVQECVWVCKISLLLQHTAPWITVLLCRGSEMS